MFSGFECCVVWLADIVVFVVKCMGGFVEELICCFKLFGVLVVGVDWMFLKE